MKVRAANGAWVEVASIYEAAGWFVHRALEGDDLVVTDQRSGGAVVTAQSEAEARWLCDVLAGMLPCMDADDVQHRKLLSAAFAHLCELRETRRAYATMTAPIEAAAADGG